MGHNLENTTALLARTPRALDALLRDLPEFWTLGTEGGSSWSPFEVVAHLIHGEKTDWIPRAKIILESGDARTFDKFDMGGHAAEMQGKSIGQLLDEFAALRAKSLDELKALNLKPSDMERRGRHPVFGPVTLSQLLATWAGHDLTHLHQISRILAGQYREEVGPWSAFLGVLHCGGHSSV